MQYEDLIFSYAIKDGYVVGSAIDNGRAYLCEGPEKDTSLECRPAISLPEPVGLKPSVSKIDSTEVQ